MTPKVRLTLPSAHAITCDHVRCCTGPLNSHLDRHENIGKGKLGMKFFSRLMRDERFKNLPMILETPCSDNSVYQKEIVQLYDTLSS